MTQCASCISASTMYVENCLLIIFTGYNKLPHYHAGPPLYEIMHIPPLIQNRLSRHDINQANHMFIINRYNVDGHR